jgi:hypothetical protein
MRLIGTVGHFAPSELQTNFYNESSQLSAEKRPNPQGQRPLWVKKKHFPPATQSHQSFHLRSTGSVILCNDTKQNIHPEPSDVSLQILLTSVAKPRDPPLI